MGRTAPGLASAALALLACGRPTASIAPQTEGHAPRPAVSRPAAAATPAPKASGGPSPEGALDVATFRNSAVEHLPARLRVRGFVIDVTPVVLADSILGEGSLLFEGVPSAEPPLVRGSYYVFEVLREAPDAGGPGFAYVDHATAGPPRATSAPTYPDGSWSIRALRRRADLQAGDSFWLTATFASVYHCGRCPRGRRCSPCQPPHFTLSDDPAGAGATGGPSAADGMLELWPWRSGFTSPPTIGKRYVFGCRLDRGKDSYLRIRCPLVEAAGGAAPRAAPVVPDEVETGFSDGDF